MAEAYDAQNRLVAKTIIFSGGDFQGAEATQAGLWHRFFPGSQRNDKHIAENDQEIKDASERFSKLTESDTKDETTVFFASGSKSLSAEAQSSLRDLARNGVGPNWLPHRSKRICRPDRKCIH